MRPVTDSFKLGARFVAVVSGFGAMFLLLLVFAAISPRYFIRFCPSIAVSWRVVQYEKRTEEKGSGWSEFSTRVYLDWKNSGREFLGGRCLVGDRIERRFALKMLGEVEPMSEQGPLLLSLRRDCVDAEDRRCLANTLCSINQRKYNPAILELLSDQPHEREVMRRWLAERE